MKQFSQNLRIQGIPCMGWIWVDVWPLNWCVLLQQECEQWGWSGASSISLRVWISLRISSWCCFTSYHCSPKNLNACSCSLNLAPCLASTDLTGSIDGHSVLSQLAASTTNWTQAETWARRPEHWVNGLLKAQSCLEWMLGAGPRRAFWNNVSSLAAGVGDKHQWHRGASLDREREGLLSVPQGW